MSEICLVVMVDKKLKQSHEGETFGRIIFLGLPYTVANVARSGK
jgi:hypothetical protein